ASRGSATGRAILNRAVAYIPDVREDLEYRLQREAETVGFLSVVAVPLLDEGNPIGTINVTGAEPAMFTERQIAMLRTVAGQGVIAIENTRLFNELQTRNRDLTEALEQQTATSEILRVISQSQRDVQPVFDSIASNARRLTGGTTAWVNTYDGELIHSRAADGASPEALEAVAQNGGCHRAASVRTPEQFLHEPWLTYQTFARTLSMASKPSLKSLDSAVRLRCLCFARAIQSEPFV